MNPSSPKNRRKREQGFSLVEIVVASSIAAIVFGVGALLYHTVSVHQKRHSSYASVTLGAALIQNYYELTDTGGAIDVFEAPHYGRAAMAENLRARFWDDIRYASAVYCLGRDVPNTVRPDYIPLAVGIDGRTLDTPDKFRLHLASVLPASADIFTAWRGASTQTCGTIYIIRPGAFTDGLDIQAIYEIDINRTTEPLGTYASVRRYQSDSTGTMIRTDFYDVFYSAERGKDVLTYDTDGNPIIPTLNSIEVFSPIFVMHERRERMAFSETAYNKFKKAAEMPFYFIWWPDPAASNLRGESVPYASYSSNATLAAYGNMGGKTAFMLTVPMFPGLN